MPMAIVDTTTPKKEDKFAAKSELDIFNIATKAIGIMLIAFNCILLEDIDR